MKMYEPRYSIRRRALRVARQRGWVAEGGGGMVLPAVLLAVAAIAVTGFVFALLPTAIAGLLVGWIASRITGARLGLGWTLLSGIAGAWLGEAVFRGLLHVPVQGLFNPLALVSSVLGATILIVFARAVARPALPGPSRPRFGRI
jgi:uncharacterized membrane protein YeaQ/YmgE (transglycosylase-associated protein family)